MTESEDALAEAPLLRPLHERHPDVDIVVLPAEPRSEADRLPPVPVDPAVLDAERAVVDGVLDGLLGAVGATTEPTTTWRSAAERGYVVPVAEARLPFGDAAEGITLGRAVGARLRAEGWAGGLRRTGATVLLQAARDDRSVRVAWLDDAVLVTVRGRDLAVDAPTARALVSGREEAR
ncbi:hypothetical protein [Cellulomonas sp. Marseille-Q8402]